MCSQAFLTLTHDNGSQSSESSMSTWTIHLPPGHSVFLSPHPQVTTLCLSQALPWENLSPCHTFKCSISKNTLLKLPTLYKHSYLPRLLIYLSPTWKCSDLIDISSSVSNLTSFHSISMFLSSPSLRSTLILFCQSLTFLNIFWSHLFNKIIILCLRWIICFCLSTPEKPSAFRRGQVYCNINSLSPSPNCFKAARHPIAFFRSLFFHIHCIWFYHTFSILNKSLFHILSLFSEDDLYHRKRKTNRLPHLSP